MTILIVTAAVVAAVLVLGLVGAGSMDFYAASQQQAARERDRASVRASRAKAKAARRRASHNGYRTTHHPRLA